MLAWQDKDEREVYTAKNVTHLTLVVNFTGLLHFVDKLQQTCQFYQIATNLLKSGFF